MDRAQLAELHYITPIANVPSILSIGLLSHQRAARVPHQSVAMAQIQQRRASVQVPGGRRLHDYVNLYLNGRNPMMHTVVGDGRVNELTLLRVAPQVLDLDGVVIADCNASSDYVRFGDARRGLASIDHGEVFARYWTHPGDPIAQMRHKSRMCAEVLVPAYVEADLIVDAYVCSPTARNQLAAVAPDLSVTVDGYKFFS